MYLTPKTNPRNKNKKHTPTTNYLLMISCFIWKQSAECRYQFFQSWTGGTTTAIIIIAADTRAWDGSENYIDYLCHWLLLLELGKQLHSDKKRYGDWLPTALSYFFTRVSPQRFSPQLGHGGDAIDGPFYMMTTLFFQHHLWYVRATYYLCWNPDYIN